MRMVPIEKLLLSAGRYDGMSISDGIAQPAFTSKNGSSDVAYQWLVVQDAVDARLDLGEAVVRRPYASRASSRPARSRRYRDLAGRRDAQDFSIAAMRRWISSGETSSTTAQIVQRLPHGSFTHARR